MRAIKFRCWDDESGEMINEVGVDPAGVAYKFPDDLAGYDTVSADSADYWPDGKLMQFTGLIDMNKIEVYEGDILRITNPMTKNSVIKSVWWNGETTRFNGIPTSLVNVYEVIGNIYESPQLLEQEITK